MSDESQVFLEHAGPAPKGGFQFTMSSPGGTAIAALAESFGAMLKEGGGTNWVECQVTHEEYGPLIVTVQRENGETPGQQIARLREQLQKAGIEPVC